MPTANVPFAMGAFVAERVDGARLVRFDGADHFMVVTRSDEVFGALFEFLEEHRPAEA